LIFTPTTLFSELHQNHLLKGKKDTEREEKGGIRIAIQ
jgi:hypothetical protein